MRVLEFRLECDRNFSGLMEKGGICETEYISTAYFWLFKAVLTCD